MATKIKTKMMLLGLWLLIFSLPLASALVEPKTERVVISGEESLTSLLKYQQLQHPDGPIISKTGDICYLSRPLYVAAKSTFRFKGEDCKELRMYAGTYIRIAGTAYFSNIKITSADKTTNQPINISRETYNQVRPYISTDTTADYIGIENSEFSYLGSYTDANGVTWGVSFWFLKGADINHSKFHHNYFGVYTWETKNVTIQNSTFHDNIEYGLDFHDNSNNFMVKNNTVYNNGNHAIIFSKFCDNNKIIGNHVYDHRPKAFVKGKTKGYGIHGIMLHEQSNNNLVAENVLENNDDAIKVYHSSNNVIENNIVINDLDNGIYLDNSPNNKIQNNITFNTKGYGLYSFYSDNNTYKDNYLERGSYFKRAINGQEQNFGSTEKYVPQNILQLAGGNKNPTEKKQIAANSIPGAILEQTALNPISNVQATQKQISNPRNPTLDNPNSEVPNLEIPSSETSAETNTYSLNDPDYSFPYPDQESVEQQKNLISSKDNIIDHAVPIPTTVAIENGVENKISGLAAFMDYKMYRIVAIAAFTAIIFGTEIVYKRFKK